LSSPDLKYLELCESGEAAREETYVLPSYCSFLKNALLPSECTIKELEWDSLKTEKQSEAKTCFGDETEMLLKLDEKSSISVKKNSLLLQPISQIFGKVV
jgi:hypothetical protein